MSAKKKIAIGVTLVVVLAAALALAANWQSVLGAPTRQVPTVRVKRGNIEQKVYTAGELRPARSASLLHTGGAYRDRA